MQNLNYEEFTIQPYLLNVDISKEEKLLLMRWRIRMAEFGENFKGGRKSVECPLCFSHPDTQQKSFLSQIDKWIEY